jgi:hypothetical protein
MRKLRTLLPVVAVLAAVAGYMIASSGLAGSPAAAAAPTPAAPAQLRLDVRFGADPRIDIPPPGPSVGDLHVLDDLLFKGGRQVGHTGGVCTLTDLAGQRKPARSPSRSRAGSSLGSGSTRPHPARSWPSRAARASTETCAARPEWSNSQANAARSRSC